MVRNQNVKKQNGSSKAGGPKNKKKFGNGGGGFKKSIVGKDDARNTIIAKNRSNVVDARDKLASLAKKMDARQKLVKIRNFKEGKLNVKKTVNGGITITTTTSGSLLLTTAKKDQNSNKQANKPQQRKNQPNNNKSPGVNRQQGGNVVKRTPKSFPREKFGRERNLARSEAPNRHQASTSSGVQGGKPTFFKRERSPPRNDTRRHTSSAPSHYRPSSHSGQNNRRESQRADDTYRRQDPVFSSGRTPDRFSNAGASYSSPLQGTKVIVTNLQISVSQEDIAELFGDVGPLKRAKVTSPGVAEVVYVNHTDALKSIEVYHNRQLDGKSMRCQIVGAAPSYPEIKPSSYSRSQGYGPDTPYPDVNVIHRALFDDRRGRRY